MSFWIKFFFLRWIMFRKYYNAVWMAIKFLLFNSRKCLFSSVKMKNFWLGTRRSWSTHSSRTPLCLFFFSINEVAYMGSMQIFIRRAELYIKSPLNTIRVKPRHTLLVYRTGNFSLFRLLKQALRRYVWLKRWVSCKSSDIFWRRSHGSYFKKCFLKCFFIQFFKAQSKRIKFILKGGHVKLNVKCIKEEQQLEIKKVNVEVSLQKVFAIFLMADKMRTTVCLIFVSVQRNTVAERRASLFFKFHFQTFFGPDHTGWGLVASNTNNCRVVILLTVLKKVTTIKIDDSQRLWSLCNSRGVCFSKSFKSDAKTRTGKIHNMNNIIYLNGFRGPYEYKRYFGKLCSYCDKADNRDGGKGSSPDSSYLLALSSSFLYS